MRHRIAVDRAVAAADPPLTEQQASTARTMLRDRRIQRVVVRTLPDGEPFSAVGEGSGLTGWRRLVHRAETPDNIEIMIRPLAPEELPPEEFLNTACPVPTRRRFPVHAHWQVEGVGDDPVMHKAGVVVWFGRRPVSLRWRRRYRVTIHFN